MTRRTRNTGVKSKVVLANGVFDLLHLGHISHLEKSKRKGETLVVSVTRDRSVNKGPDRPYMHQYARARILRALKVVDRVVLVDSSLEALKKVKPDFFAKGSEYVGKIRQEDLDWCAENDCRIRFTGHHIDSSTRLNDLIRGG